MRKNLRLVVLSITVFGVQAISSCQRGNYSLNTDPSATAALNKQNGGGTSSGGAGSGGSASGGAGSGGSTNSGGTGSGGNGSGGGGTTGSGAQPQVTSGTMTNQVITLRGSGFQGSASLTLTDMASGASVGSLSVLSVSPDGSTLTAQPTSSMLSILASRVYNLLITSASAAQSLAIPISFSGSFSGPITIASTSAGGAPSMTGNALSSGLGAVFSYGGSTASVLDFGMLANGSHWLQATNPTNQSVNYPILINPNGGGVGIATASPKAALHVDGPALTGTVTSSGTNVLGVGTVFTTSFTAGDTILIAGQAGVVASVISDTILTTSTAFSPAIAVGSPYQKVGAILNSGAVGIGTASPTASLLHVGSGPGGNTTASIITTTPSDAVTLRLVNTIIPGSPGASGFAQVPMIQFCNGNGTSTVTNCQYVRLVGNSLTLTGDVTLTRACPAGYTMNSSGGWCFSQLKTAADAVTASSTCNGDGAEVCDVGQYANMGFPSGTNVWFRGYCGINQMGRHTTGGGWGCDNYNNSYQYSCCYFRK